MNAFTHFFDHRFVGHLPDHVVPKLKNALQFAIDPDQQFDSIKSRHGGLENVFGERRDAPQYGFAGSSPQSSRDLQDLAFRPRHAIKPRSNDPLDTRGNSKLVDRTDQSEVAPLAPKRAVVLEATTNLFDKEWDVGRMRNDPVFQIGIVR